jgi:fucose permease
MQNALSSTQEQERDSRLFILLLFGFVVIGIVNTFLGPLIPALSARWNLDYSQAGYLFTMQFAGSTTGAALSGALMKRAGIVRLITFGLIFMAVCVIGIGLGGRVMGTAAVFCSGVALGITIPTINLSVAEMYSSRRAEALNILNLAWGVGAVASPLLIARLANESNITLPLITISAMLIAVSILAAFFRSSNLRLQQSEIEPVAQSESPALLNPQVWTGALLIFLYVGVETSTGGWLASYAKNLNASTGSFWAMVQSLFWAGLLVGRMAAPIFLRYLSATSLVLTGMIMSAIGIAIILMGTNLTIVSVGAVVSGLGMAPVFPTTLALITERLGARASQITGYMFVAAGLGGAITPWFVGFVSSRYGNLRAGLSAALAGAILLIVLQSAIIIRMRQGYEKAE